MKGFWRKVFGSGLKTVFLVAVLAFLGRLVLVEILTPLWQPLITALWGELNSVLILLLTVGFTLLTIIIIGLLIEGFRKNEKVKRGINNVSRKIPVLKLFAATPEGMKDRPACFVEFAPESYYIAALIKEIKFKRVFGKTFEWCVLYSPGAPIPGSGLPIIFVRKSRVIPLNIPFGMVSQITISFGAGTPDEIEELDTSSAA